MPSSALAGQKQSLKEKRREKGVSGDRRSGTGGEGSYESGNSEGDDGAIVSMETMLGIVRAGWGSDLENENVLDVNGGTVHDADKQYRRKKKEYQKVEISEYTFEETGPVGEFLVPFVWRCVMQSRIFKRKADTIYLAGVRSSGGGGRGDEDFSIDDSTSSESQASKDYVYVDEASVQSKGE